MPSNANSNFLTRIPEPVSTTYAPYRGVCVRTKGVYGILSTPQKTSSIRSDTIRHPPYYGLFEAYLRLIYVTTSLPLRNVRELFINNPEGGDEGLFYRKTAPRSLFAGPFF